MNPLDHAIAILLIVVVPPYTVFSYRRFVAKVASDGTRARRRGYVTTVVQHWTVSLATIALFVFNDRSLADLGLSQPSGWGIAIAIGLVAILVSLQFWQLAHADDPYLAAAVRAKLNAVRPLLPANDKDERLFAAVAFTAGICEEIMYRGFLTWYFSHVLPAPAAIALAALAFGLAHAYQGPRGIVTTGIVGLVMAGLVLLTGSLWIAMLVHALVDLNSGLLARRVLSGEPRVMTS